MELDLTSRAHGWRERKAGERLRRGKVLPRAAFIATTPGMKTSCWSALLVLATAGAVAGGAAEERFSQAVAPADFSAAGLGKLTPQELARLDALVKDYRSGALEAARREAAVAADGRTKAEAAAARAEATARTERERAAKAEARAQGAAAGERDSSSSDAGLLKRAKVLLTPGTKIEYTTVDARIAGEFRGWQPRMVFTLDNGQRWQVTSSESYVTSSEPGPKVKIVPGALGTFWMHVEGHRQRAKVAILSDGK